MSLPVCVTQRIEQLKAENDGPLCAYVYDLPALERHVKAMRQVLPQNCELFYAAKANPEAPVLKTLAPWVDGFEAASGGCLLYTSDAADE